MIEQELRFKVEVPSHLVDPLEDSISVRALVRNSVRHSDEAKTPRTAATKQTPNEPEAELAEMYYS